MSLRVINILFFALLSFVIKAQKITNVDFKVGSNELKISYDLEYGQKNTLYDVKVLVELEKKNWFGN